MRNLLLRGGRAFLVILTVLALTSCVGASNNQDREASPGSATRDEGLPPGFDVTFRWPANDRFDPMSAEGTFIRAYVESFYLAQEGQSLSWAYPGFVDASPSDTEAKVRALPSQSASSKLVGTSTFSVLSRLQRGNRTRVVLCEFGYHSSVDSSGAKRWRTHPKSSLASIIEFSRLGQAPPAGQRGIARRPDSDVFGDWKVDDFEFLASAGGFPEEAEGCNAEPLPSGVPAEAEVRGSGPMPRSPQPQDPGWPAGSAL